MKPTTRVISNAQIKIVQPTFHWISIRSLPLLNISLVLNAVLNFARSASKNHMVTGNVSTLATTQVARLKFLSGSARIVTKIANLLSVVNAKRSGAFFAVQMTISGYIIKCTNLALLVQQLGMWLKQAAKFKHFSLSYCGFG